MVTIRYHTTPSLEEFTLEDKEFAGLLVRREKDLYDGEENIGELLHFSFHDSVHHQNLFQAEFYFRALESDIFFDRGLVQRATKKSLSSPTKKETVSSIRGIVISRPIDHSDQIILLQERELSEIVDAIDYHHKNGLSFTEYRVESRMGERKEYRYFPPQKKDGTILDPRVEIETEMKKTEDKANVELEYWQQKKVITESCVPLVHHGKPTTEREERSKLELVAEHKTLETGLKISLSRSSISLSRKLGQNIQLQGNLFSAVKGVIELYQNKNWLYY